MWLFLPGAFLSIVQSPEEEYLVVRAVREGDIESVFGKDVDVLVGAGKHYIYRATIRREILQQVLAKEVEFIDYDNFTESVLDPLRKQAYSTVSTVVGEYQNSRQLAPKASRDHLLKSEGWDGCKPWVRLINTVAGFNRVHGVWPTMVLMPDNQINPLRKHCLTHLGWRYLCDKLDIIPNGSLDVIVAVDAEKRCHAYGPGSGSIENAECWLGFR